MIKIDEGKCAGCANCLIWCPVEGGAVTVYGISTVNYEKCVECLTCIDYCPCAAISWED